MRLKLNTLLIIALAVGTAGAEERWVGFSDDHPFSEARIEVGRSGVETFEFEPLILSNTSAFSLGSNSLSTSRNVSVNSV